MQPVRAICFDLDDTLLDDEASYAASLALTCDEIDVCYPGLDRATLLAAHDELSKAAWRARVTNQSALPLAEMRRYVWREALAACGCRDERVLETALTTYSRHRLTSVRCFDDAAATLSELHGRYRLAVITNGFAETQLLRLKAIGLAHYFDLVVTLDDTGTAKPDPAVFRFALDRLEAGPDEAWHVGDGLDTDVAGAFNAGLAAAVWLNRRGAPRPEGLTPLHEIASLSALHGFLRDGGA